MCLELGKSNANLGKGLYQAESSTQRKTHVSLEAVTMPPWTFPHLQPTLEYLPEDYRRSSHAIIN